MKAFEVWDWNRNRESWPRLRDGPLRLLFAADVQIRYARRAGCLMSPGLFPVGFYTVAATATNLAPECDLSVAPRAVRHTVLSHYMVSSGRLTKNNRDQSDPTDHRNE
jgi:hypothetical protein